MARRVPGDRLRIALSHQFCWPEVRRGGERYLHELAAGLQRAGHAVLVVSSAERPGRREQDGVPVRLVRRRAPFAHRLGETSTELGFAAQAALPVLAHRPDVWHALGTRDGAAAAIASAAVPRLVSAYTELGVPAAAYRMRRPDAHAYLAVVRHADDFSCLSRSAADVLVRDFGRTPRVQPGGVRLDDFTPGARDPRPTVLFSGAFGEPRKNVAALLEACVVVRADVPDLQVWLSGPGDPRPLFDAVPEAADLVTSAVLDDRATLAMRYAAAWCVALPSEREAQGLAVLEGLASGTPALVLAGEAPADMVAPSTGVAAAGAVDLPNALRAVLELAASPGTAGACREAAAAWDWDLAIVPRMVEAYEVARG